MKRTRKWWAILTPNERSELVWIERYANDYHSGGGYLPDDCSECGACGQAMHGVGLCPQCSKRLDEIIGKADDCLNERNMR